MVDDLFKSIDKMILLNNNKDNNELWVSSDVLIALDNLKQYKGYEIYSSVLMPKDYMVIGNMYFKE